ncbi:DNA gyrase subunit A [Nocardioides plantarum]|uniref:DNA gyrase subunit A n=1 Tax=Nocardioides plantarum TaxID=29299 RepID=A0ABV5K8H2_9ACTN|nr:DNA gyrase subunit A [Nocardioides plantarum]
MTDQQKAYAKELERATERLQIVQAMALASEEPHRLVDVLFDAVDVSDASSRVRAEFGFSEVQAEAVLDAQFRRLSRRDRDRMAQMVVDTQAAVDELTELANGAA